MKPVRYTASLLVKLEPATREAIEQLATTEQTSLGGATRLLIAEGMAARGLV